MEIDRFRIFPEFSKLDIFLEFSKSKINKFPECYSIKNLQVSRIFSIWKTEIWLKKLVNFGIVRPFEISNFSQFCQYLYVPFDINQFRRFNFSIFISYFNESHKFGRSTFEQFLIFKFKTSGILKFYCLKFKSSSEWASRFLYKWNTRM